MAVTIVTILDGIDSFIADVIADADADTTATIPHGIVAPGQDGGIPGRGGAIGAGVIPLEVTITPLIQAVAALSEWSATTIDATNVVLTKSTAVGSGDAAAQVRCIIKRPSSYGI